MCTSILGSLCLTVTSLWNSLSLVSTQKLRVRVLCVFPYFFLWLSYRFFHDQLGTVLFCLVCSFAPSYPLVAVVGR